MPWLKSFWKTPQGESRGQARLPMTEPRRFLQRFAPLHLGVPRTFVRVGLYFRGSRQRFARRPPPKTAPQCRPKGSLSLTRMNSKKTAPVKYPATHNSQSQTTHQYLGYCLKSPTENHLFQKNMDEPAVPQ